MTVRKQPEPSPCPYEVGTWLKTPQGDIGYVNLVLDQYLTLCVREWKKSEELAKHSCQPIHQCILLVYPTDYDKCEVLTEGDFERVKHP